MNTGIGIFSLLSNDAAVTAIASNRIFPVISGKNSDKPFVTYDIITVQPDDTKTGVSKVDAVDVECVCHAETYSAMADLADAVRSALDRQSVTTATVTIDSIQYQSGNVEVTDRPRKFMAVLEFKVRQRMS